MPEQTFEQFIKKERDRLAAARSVEESRLAEVQKKIDEIDREMVAIDAYEAAKTGTTARPRRAGTRRTGRRDEVLAVIKKHPKGISRGDILTAMQAKGDRSEETSISNALAALKRTEKLTLKDGKYTIA